MSWNGSGVFSRIYSWVADKNAGIDITASRMDADTNDITSNGFGNTLTRDGQGSASANLPMNNFRHTGVGNGQSRTDYAALGQAQDGVGFNWTITGGTADALTATYTPAITALVDGQLCFARATAANATTTPTFAPNGLTARTITKQGGAALSPGEIAGNFAEIILRYNLANTRWELLNPAQLFQMPLGAIMPYTGSTVPSSNFVFPAGQAISRTTFAAYFALVGTAFGTGDGVTTFNVPDLRGRAIFGLDNMGGSAANRITVAGGNFDGTVIGGTGGAQNHTLTFGEIPAHTHSVTITDPQHTHGVTFGAGTQPIVNAGGAQFGASGGTIGNASLTINNASTGITAAVPTTGGGGSQPGGSAHTVLSPSMTLPVILRVA